MNPTKKKKKLAARVTVGIGSTPREFVDVEVSFNDERGCIEIHQRGEYIALAPISASLIEWATTTRSRDGVAAILALNEGLGQDDDVDVDVDAGGFR